jgi:hypothetical protein
MLKRRGSGGALRVQSAARVSVSGIKTAALENSVLMCTEDLA